MSRFLNISDAVDALASVLARIFLAAIALMLVVQVVLRFSFSYSLPWPEEASRYLMIWVVMLTASRLVRYNELVRVDFLDALWPPRLLVYRNLLFRLVMVAMFSLMAYQGWLQAEFAWPRQTAATQLSWFWPYLAIPVGCVLVVLQLIAVTLREIATGTQAADHISELTENP